MNYRILTSLLFIFCCNLLTAQTNAVKIKAILNAEKDELKIQQKIVFHNTSDSTFTTIFLHNWANSFANKNTPLAKRFLNDYRKDFNFSKENERGHTIIHNITIDYQIPVFNEVINHPDILKIELNKPLQPKDSVTITAFYTIKFPNAKFTGYGKTLNGYHFRFWYLIPAVFKKDWQLMSNLNLDDLFEEVADFDIEIDLPKKYFLESNLYKYKTEKDGFNSFYLIGRNKKDIIISLDTAQKFKSYKTKNVEILTDIHKEYLDKTLATSIVKRELSFIESFLGKYPNREIFVDWNSVGKNSLHDIYGLPEWLNAFPKNYRWEMRFLKALTIKYTDDVLLLNRRKDYWLTDGIQTFIMIEYVKKYYPDMTILGKFSKYWPLKKYNIAKLKQNDKYPFVYQFSARRFYDQPLTTRADSLSNFNRKIISKYKAGLGFRYLQDFIGDSILKSSFKEFYLKNKLKITDSKEYAKILQSKTEKDLGWFFGDYVQTNKKIDYKISKVVQHKDSLEITIKNKRNITAPVAIYGVKDKKIIFKKWITNVDSIKTIKIARNGFDKLALNYEQLYPEYNSLDNFRRINNSLINKPLQFRFYRDIEDPYYNQIFYRPDIKYNLYDGIILGVNFNNKPVIAHNFEFSLTPNYSTKRKNFTGGYSLAYNQYIQKGKIYRISYGVGGSNYHYAPELGYNSFSPSVNIQFKRNSLRDVGSKFLLTRLVYINKEVSDLATVYQRDKYTIFNIRYVNSKPNVVRRFQYAVNAEFGNNFTKFSSDIRYRKELTRNNSLELRLFGGFFLNNTSKGNYFSFGLNRSSDYLFEQSLFGRSESFWVI